MRRIFSGPVTSVAGFEIGIGADRKLVMDENGNITSFGSFIFEEGLIGDLTGNVTGSLTGNVTGDVVGDITGSLTGNVVGNVTGNLIGNVSGDLTGNVLGNIVGDVTGNLYGITIGAVFGDFLSAVTTETSTELADSFSVEEGVWRIFKTSTGGLAVMSTEGVQMLTLSTVI